MLVNSESVSNETDESNSQHEKHNEQRIWTWRGMKISDSFPKYRINFMFNECRMKFDFITKCELLVSIDIERLQPVESAETSMNSTFWGIVIDSRGVQWKAFDSIRQWSEKQIVEFKTARGSA
jgi:hypothetical protein